MVSKNSICKEDINWYLKCSFFISKYWILKWIPINWIQITFFSPRLFLIVMLLIRKSLLYMVIMRTNKRRVGRESLLWREFKNLNFSCQNFFTNQMEDRGITSMKMFFNNSECDTSQWFKLLEYVAHYFLTFQIVLPLPRLCLSQVIQFLHAATLVPIIVTQPVGKLLFIYSWC